MSVTLTHLAHNEIDVDVVFLGNDLCFHTSGMPPLPQFPPLGCALELYSK